MAAILPFLEEDADEREPEVQPLGDLKDRYWAKGESSYTRDKHTEYVDVDVLWKYREFDRRTHGEDALENIKDLAEHIRQHGIAEPLILNYYQGDRTALLVEGNHRLVAAREAGLRYVPVRVMRSGRDGPKGRPGRRDAVPVPGIEPNQFDYVPGDMTPSMIGIPSVPLTEEDKALDNAPLGAGKRPRIEEGFGGLTRLGPGFYQTADGAWEIERGVEGSWKGEWVVRSLKDRSTYSDPLPTLADAKRWIQNSDGNKGGFAGWAEQDRDPARAHLEANHANLTRFVWGRRLVEDHLSTCRYWLERAGGAYYFHIDPPLPADVVPWKLIGTTAKQKAAGAAVRGSFPLIGEGNGKMECPAWDLPAGAPVLGGACPGATLSQTAVDLRMREHLLKKGLHPPGGPPVPFREIASICSACYAGEGNFGYSENLAASALRLAWTRALLATEEGTQEWIEIMAAAITAMSIPLADDEYSNEPFRPFRVHSSGDFFTPAYAKAWMRLANRVYQIDPKIRFWCPTRTWAVSGFNWKEILAGLDQPNLVVRASAYHVGDPAPGGLTDPGRPGYAKGSTSLVALPEPGKKAGVFHVVLPDAVSEGEDDPRAEHNCPVYALKEEGRKGSCGEARCRVCWTRPDASVNYSLH